MRVELGDKVKDKLTGFEGIIIVNSTYLNGCIRVGIQSDKLQGGKPLDVEYVDIVQVEVLQKGVIKPHHQTQVEIEPPAGPAPIPQRQGDPIR